MYRFFSRFFLLVLLLGILGLFGSGLRAQGAYGLKRAEFDVHVGPSIPIGSFGKAAFSGYSGDKNLPYHGAKVGVDYGLSFGYYISPNWGVMLLFNGHSNKMRVDEPFSLHRPNDWTWQTEKVDKWTEFMAMAGVTYRASLTDWLVFSLRAHIGYAHLISPFYRAVAHQNRDYTFKINSASGHSFGYGAGAAFKFILAPGFHLDVRCDYLGTAPFHFKNVGWGCSYYNESTGTTVEAVDASQQKKNIKESFQVINVNFGFTAAF